eukprot:1139054-Pelagomonas_calceolata.AAC.3
MLVLAFEIACTSTISPSSTPASRVAVPVALSPAYPGLHVPPATFQARQSDQQPARLPAALGKTASKQQATLRSL